MGTQTVCHACFVKARTVSVSQSVCSKANADGPTTTRMSMPKNAPNYKHQTSSCRLLKLMLCCSNVCNDGHRKLTRTAVSTSKKLILGKLTVKSPMPRTPP